MSSPRYSQIASQLASGIATGRYPLGSNLPTELELAQQFSTSRQTVRVALKELQQLGMVSRKKRAGTKVEAATPSEGFSQSLATLGDLAQLAKSQTRVIQAVEEVVLDRALARELRCAPGTRWIRLELIRSERYGSSERPIGWTAAYLAPEYAQVPDLLRAAPKSLIASLIEKHFGRRVAEVEQSVQAVALPQALASALQAPAGSPALKIIRRYIDQASEAFEVTVTIHPADRMVISARLRRDPG